VGPLTEASFPYADLDILELYEHSKRVRPVIDLVSTMFHDMSVFNRCVHSV
jgi:UDP-glucose:glycoprotein glucosyltransferase